MKRCGGCGKRIWPWQRNNKHVAPMHIHRCWTAYIKGSDEMNEFMRRSPHWIGGEIEIEKEE